MNIYVRHGDQSGLATDKGLTLFYSVLSPGKICYLAIDEDQQFYLGCNYWRWLGFATTGAAKALSIDYALCAINKAKLIELLTQLAKSKHARRSCGYSLSPEQVAWLTTPGEFLAITAQSIIDCVESVGWTVKETLGVGIINARGLARLQVEAE